MVLRIAPTPPDSARIISVHIFPQWSEWATTERRLTRQRNEPPERAPVSPDSARFLPTLIRLDSGLGPKNFKLFKVFGASSRSAKIRECVIGGFRRGQLRVDRYKFLARLVNVSMQRTVPVKTHTARLWSIRTYSTLQDVIESRINILLNHKT